MPRPSTDPSLAELRRRAALVTARDQRRLRRRLDALTKGEAAADRAALERELLAAEERVERRRASVPAITYPAALPISGRTADIAAALREHQVVVVAGETGSGKSTQLPKLCLELGRGVRGLVGHTQPRRIAARAVAERVAEELGGTLGDVVGYTVRFTDRVSDRTLVKVMTDGILLAEIQRDRMLRDYDTIIVDEAHERSLNIDFLLGYLGQLLPRRRGADELKLVITSATIDTERFAQHFDAPVIEVSGRTYPVEVRYRPFGADGRDGRDGRDGGAAPGAGDERDQIQAVCDAVEELGAEPPGDVLVFLSGEREIHDTADALRRLALPATEILPLYARLSAGEQHRVFQPHPGRRIVLATNVAETSLTVPGVRYVVDAGTARISRYSRRLKVQRLPIEAISRASADQRAGRCGRVAPGVCLRLYTEDDYAGRPEFTEPEILRTNLASVILQMEALGLGDVASFPFVDPPDTRAVKDGVQLLEELGALDPAPRDPRRRLTPTGRTLAQLPLDPRLGRMVLEAQRHGCVREVMVIAAALSIQDPRERPTEGLQEAAALHARFADPDSDFLSYLRLWEHLRQRQSEMSSNQFRKLCRAEHLHYLRVREWQDLYSQLRQVAGGLGIGMGEGTAHPDVVHRSLLAGLLSHVGLRHGDTGEYLGARGARFSIGAGSVLAKKPPRWVMAAELVETNRVWARVAARIQPEWIEHLGGHLLKRSHGDPRWDARRATAMTTERVTLYGLPIVTARPVPWRRIDPAGARDLFVRHALVEGDWDADHGADHGAAHAFLAANAARVAEVLALEDRVRRRGLLVDEDTRAAFFAARLPADVDSGRRFDAWWRRRRAEDPDLLHFRLADLLGPAARTVDPADHPDVWHQGALSLALSYEFEPGSVTDGVTVHLALPVLDRVRATGFDWQVPGRREELVTTLVRSLPKDIRRHVGPAGDQARAFLASAAPADGPLLDVLARSLARTAGVAVPVEAFRLDRVPDHLLVTFVVEDLDGRWLALGKDLDVLQRDLRGEVRAAIARATGVVEHDGLRAWTADTLGTLPRRVSTTGPGPVVHGYPALVDQGDAVGVRVFANAADQDAAMRAATRRLLLVSVPSPRRALERSLPNETKLALLRTPLGPLGALLDDCTGCAVDALVVEAGGPAWDADAFAELREVVRARLPSRTAAVLGTVGHVVGAVAAIEGRLAQLGAASLAPSVADVRAQLARLVRPGFVTATGAGRLGDLLRYVCAVEQRLDKLPEQPARDRDRTRALQALEREYETLRDTFAPGPVPDEVAELRWLLEELRVSTFAQVIGTPVPVSEPRLRRALARAAARGG
jgi:ATP-dependent helicase HrpA